MFPYQCTYVPAGRVPADLLNPTIRLQAANALAAALLTRAITGCDCVLEVERVAQ
ncbi:hypothetical protein SAMN05216551_105300 [Chitinasiproducens palmae]|uniref:Uncharacterized protein n=1 Tax=Chitinasiproducens palmae TaxID=1770053 RepID=A0A1H2PQK9_9BURK|nr:hypothetical protein SAMN05216551_105300 [Chitinasiproducens palmae]